MPNNTLRNPTKWAAPSGTGFFSYNGGSDVTTLSKSLLTTLSGVQILTDSTQYSPKYSTAWTTTGKNASSWQPKSGVGYVVTQGTLNFATNTGSLITDDSGDFIVTTPTYDSGKNPTAWSSTGV